MSGDYVSTADAPVEVPFSDDETETPEEAIVDSPNASPAERESAKEKRKARAAQRERERKAMEAEIQELKERDAKRDREVAELRGFVAGQSRQAPAAGGKDPYEARLEAIRQRQRTEWANYQKELNAGTIDDERTKYYEQVSHEIETEKANTLVEKALASKMPLIRQEQAQQVWKQKYQDVYDDPRAYQYANATYERRKAVGEPVTNDLIDEVMTEARTVFKLGKKAPPSASEKARMSGMPSSGSGGGGAPSGGVQMTKDLRRMATALYSDLPEEEAVKKWANGPGKTLRAQKVL